MRRVETHIPHAFAYDAKWNYCTANFESPFECLGDFFMVEIGSLGSAERFLHLLAYGAGDPEFSMSYNVFIVQRQSGWVDVGEDDTFVPNARICSFLAEDLIALTREWVAFLEAHPRRDVAG